MSRDIKFRAWNKSDNRFIKFGFAAIPLDDGMLQPNSNDIILMQYTGLKDKNGVEIYEGDIVKTKSQYWQVLFNDGAFWISNIAKKGADVLVRSTPLEVIGNIYESPGLFTQGYIG